MFDEKKPIKKEVVVALRVVGGLCMANGARGLYYQFAYHDVLQLTSISSNSVAITSLIFGFLMATRKYSNLENIALDTKLFWAFCFNLITMAIFNVVQYGFTGKATLAAVYIFGIFYVGNWRFKKVSSLRAEPKTTGEE